LVAPIYESKKDLDSVQQAFVLGMQALGGSTRGCVTGKIKFDKGLTCRDTE
jgi:hypothetical protein